MGILDTAINKVLGIQNRDREKVFLLGPIFFLVGLAYSVGIMACQTLFVSKFGIQYLPLMYLVEAGVLPVQLWLFSQITQRYSQGKLIKILYTVITLVLMACTAFLLLMHFLHWEIRIFYPILFIICNVLARILVPITWMLGDGVCQLQQAKRLYPLLGALFTLGAIAAGIVGRVMASYFNGFGTEMVFVILPVVLLASAFMWRRVITDYFLDAELEDHKGNKSSMTSVISAVWSSRFLRTALFSMVILLSLFYIIDYQFFVFIEAKYPGSDEMTQYFGVYVAVLYTVSLLVGLLLNRIFKGFGMGNILLGMGFIVTIALVMTGIVTQTSWALNGLFIGDLMIDVVSFTLIPPIVQVFYKLLPAEQRAGAALLFAGAMNAGGKLISSGITGLHSSGMVTLSILSIIGFVLAVCYLVFSWQQKHLYLSTLMESMQSHAVDLSELDSFSPRKLFGKSDLNPVVEGLQSSNPIRQSIALELSVEVNNPRLIPYVKPLLSNSNPRIRLLALQALPDAGIDQSILEELWLNCLDDPEEQIRWEVVQRLGRAELISDLIIKALRNSLNDASYRVASEAVISLGKLGDEESMLEYYRAIENMSGASDEELVQISRVIGEMGMRQYSENVMALLERESSQVRISAVQCLGNLAYTEAINEIVRLYPTADLELKREIEQAFLRMGKNSIPVLLALLSEKETDIWYLGLISVATLDSDLAICLHTLEASCIEKLTEFNATKGIADLMEKMGTVELAEFYRLRLQEISGLILKACWAVLSFSLDPIITEKIVKALRGTDADKKEQAIEVLSELSGKYPLIEHMLTLIAGVEEDKQYLQMSADEVFKKGILAFPDPWLDRFANYALLKNEKVVS